MKRELFAFSDASGCEITEMLGASIYLRATYNCNTRNGMLCMYKTQIKKDNITLPRAEFVSILHSMTLTTKVKNALDIEEDRCAYYSYRSVSLAQLERYSKEGPLSLKTFVSNVCSKILTTITVEHLNFISGASNPSDDLTRGLSV